MDISDSNNPVVSEYIVSSAKQQKRKSFLRPCSPRAPQNSTSYIIDNHIEGVEIDLSPHSDEDVPMYLANASWTEVCSFPQTVNTSDTTSHALDDASLYEDAAKDIERLQVMSPAYSDIDFEYISPIEKKDRFSYMCQDFEASFKSARASELAELTKDELVSGIMAFQDKLSHLEKEVRLRTNDTCTLASKCVNCVDDPHEVNCAASSTGFRTDFANMLHELQSENEYLNLQNNLLKESR